MRCQSLNFQAILNTAIEELEEKGENELAQKLREWTRMFADDATNLRGAMGRIKDTMTKGQFKVEYEYDDHSVVFVGIHCYKCSSCQERMGTRPDTSKHGVSFFSSQMMLDD